MGYNPGGDVVAFGTCIEWDDAMYPPRYLLPDTSTHELDDDVTVFSLHMPSNHTPYPPQYTLLEISTHKLQSDNVVFSIHTVQNHPTYPPRHNPPNTHIYSPDCDLVASSA